MSECLELILSSATPVYFPLLSDSSLHRWAVQRELPGKILLRNIRSNFTFDGVITLINVSFSNKFSEEKVIGTNHFPLLVISLCRWQDFVLGNKPISKLQRIIIKDISIRFIIGTSSTAPWFIFQRNSAHDTCCLLEKGNIWLGFRLYSISGAESRQRHRRIIEYPRYYYAHLPFL